MLVCRPLSIALRYVAIIASGSSALMTPACDQLVGVELARAGMLRDLLVHQRLRDHRLVGLVVAEAAEADEVDEHVAVELPAVLERHLDREQADLRIVGVDVEDRRLGHLRDVGAIERAAGVARVRRGEADLVVDDDVDGAARVVAAGLRHVERFLDDALPGDRRIAVDQHRQHLVALARRRADAAARAPSPRPPGRPLSRCDGLNASVRCIGPPGVITSDEKPW